MNDEHAISLCLNQHDPRGFEALVARYRREAYYHAFGLLGNHPDAEDACQDSFAAAFISLPKLDSLTAFYPWFYRILRNRCLNKLRDRRYMDDIDSVEAVDSASDPGLQMTRTVTTEQVWRALLALKPEFREILILKHLQEYRYDAISNLLGIPRGTVMSRLYHARKAFQKYYQTTEHDTEVPYD